MQQQPGRLLTKNATAITSVEDISSAIKGLGTAFEEFKQTNDARLKELEKKGASDPLLDDKLAKINEDLNALDEVKTRLEDLTKTVDAVSAKANRPSLENKSADVVAHEKAFAAFLRRGEDAALADLESKALNVTTDADGGYAVPEEIDTEISKLLINESPMRALASIQTVGTTRFKKLVSTGGTAGGWVGEAGARTETSTSQLSAVEPYFGELYANPAATQTMLDDAFFNVEVWLQQEVLDVFAEQEGAAFVAGDGLEKPRGFLNYPTASTDDATRAFGTLQAISTGVADGFSSTGPGDVMMDIYYSMKKRHRNNSTWLMASPSVGTIRQFKSGDGDYLWQPGLAMGTPSTFLSRPIETDENMPAIAASAFPIALGDWKRGYLILDRIGVRVLRDAYTNKPYVHFYTTKRVAGAVVNSQAIKLLQIAL